MNFLAKYINLLERRFRSRTLVGVDYQITLPPIRISRLLEIHVSIIPYWIEQEEFMSLNTKLKFQLKFWG